MKIKALLVAALFTLSPGVAYAHHKDHQSESSAVGTVLGLALIGTGIYLGTRDYSHHHRDHHRRHRQARVIDEYRYHGNTYRVCRRDKQVFYC